MASNRAMNWLSTCSQSSANASSEPSGITVPNRGKQGRPLKRGRGLSHPVPAQIENCSDQNPHSTGAHRRPALAYIDQIGRKRQPIQLKCPSDSNASSSAPFPGPASMSLKWIKGSFHAALFCRKEQLCQEFLLLHLNTVIRFKRSVTPGVITSQLQ